MKSAILASLASLIAAQAESLPRLSVSPDSLTVSGHQHGAIFACSLQIIYSSTIRGAGCVKGADFAQFKGDLRNDDTATEIRNRNRAIIEDLEEDGKIDPTSNLSDTAVIIVSSESDTFFVAKNQ